MLNFFKREKQEEAKDKKYEAKKKAAVERYKDWFNEMKSNASTADVVSKLDEMLLDYSRLEDEAFTYTSRVKNQKQAILNLLEDNRALLLDKHQTVKMRGYKVGFHVHTDINTTEKFSLREFLNEFTEDTVQFNLSKTAIKGAMKSETLREHLKSTGVELSFVEKWDIRDDEGWMYSSY